MVIEVTVQSEDSTKPRGFSPQTANAQVGDAVFWHNSDQKTQHQPTPDVTKPAFWVPPIPGQNSSSQINLGVAGTISYQDALNSGLTGKILVATPVQIGQQFGGGAAFSPSPVQIKVGTAICWTNADTKPHQPAPKGGPANAWLAQPIAPGQKSPPVSKFQTAGSIAYEDALDATIQGVIQVS
jgi:plastocyanin